MTEEFVATIFGMPKRNSTPEQAPSATSLANVIAFEYGIEPAHAICWLANRADEFKTVAESQK